MAKLEWLDIVIRGGVTLLTTLVGAGLAFRFNKRNQKNQNKFQIFSEALTTIRNSYNLYLDSIISYNDLMYQFQELVIDNSNTKATKEFNNLYTIIQERGREIIKYNDIIQTYKYILKDNTNINKEFEKIIHNLNGSNTNLIRSSIVLQKAQVEWFEYDRLSNETINELDEIYDIFVRYINTNTEDLIRVIAEEMKGNF